MSQFQTILLSLGALQGLFLFTLLISDRRVNYASRLLGVLCLLIAATFALPMIVAFGGHAFYWTIGYLLFLPASSGALLYLYCRTALTGLPLKPVDALHLLPLLACYLLNADLLVSGDKALAFVRQADLPLLRHNLTKAIFYGQAVFYSVLLMWMLARYQHRARENLSAYNPSIFNWLWGLAISSAAIWALKILSYFLGLPPAVNALADLLLALMVYAIVVIHWRNPSLFQIQQLAAQGGRSLPPVKPSPSEGSLDSDTRASILLLVQQQVEAQSLYRDSELTLAALADKVGVSVHQLSETLNQQGGKNFNQFINEYRVAEVCEQLRRDTDRKLIDLALEAGFASKSSFNAIFKKFTGQTPSLYRRQAGTG